MRPRSAFWRTASFALWSLSVCGLAQAQTATFSDIADAVPGRCYDATTTAPDPTNPNRLVIGMNSGIVPGTFGTSAGCVAFDEGPVVTMDTIAFVAAAPDGFYVSKVTFFHTLATSGSRGGRGFAGSSWVVGDNASTAPAGTALADLTGQNRTVVPVKITTFLAAAGGSVRSGSASAANASVVVELLPLSGPPPPDPPQPPPVPVPTTTSVSPALLTAGGPALTLTVRGTNFVSSSVVRWNGVARTTTPISGSELRAAIGASDVAIAGTAEVTVLNPPSGLYPSDGGVSNVQSITINPSPEPNPVPTTTSLEPSSAIVGSAFTLTVNGTNFIAGSIVRWNGSDRATTVVSPTRLTAAIGLLDVLAVGTATVTVFNPATGFNPPPDGGLSNPQSFTITEVPAAPPPVPGPAPALTTGGVDDRRGRVWRQLVDTRGITTAQLTTSCMQDGSTPCAGNAGTVDVTDWVWATSLQVFDLFSYFTTGVNPSTPSVSGPQYAPPATQFHGLFTPTQVVSGCTTYQGCFDFRSAGGTTASTDEAGGRTGATVNLSQNILGTFDGSFNVGTIPDDGSSARGVFLWRATGLGSGTAHAYNDQGQSPSPFGGGAVNVLLNDWVGGAQASATNASVTQLTSVSPASDRIAVGPDGIVRVTAGALAGTYTFTYNLCTLTTPASCDDAQASVVVRSYTLVAQNDQASAPYGVGGSSVNVLSNDTLNGQAVTTAVVSLSVVSSTHAGITLNTTTGAVNVAAGTPSGTHSLVYRLCEAASPANCKQATVTLLAASIDAVNDVFPKIAKSGGTSPSVLANDRFNGAVATTATVQLSLLTTLPAGITFDLTTGRFVVSKTDSGDYPVTYRICEIGNTTNCDSASLVLEISGGL